MKLRKTPESQRMTYTYFYANGDKVILEPGKSTTVSATKGIVSVVVDESITELTIMELHRQDDAEVRSNLKYINCEDNQERKTRIANKKAWTIEHPNEPNPFERSKKSMNFDAFSDDDDSLADKSKLLYQASMNVDQEEDDYYEEKLELIKELVATFPKSMQRLFNLFYIEELSQTEVCVILGVSKSTVSERVKRLEEKIKKEISEKPELFGKNAD